jgi:hypothetical protein
LNGVSSQIALAMETSFVGAITGIELLSKIEIVLWLYDLGCWSIFPSSSVDFGYGTVSMGIFHWIDQRLLRRPSTPKNLEMTDIVPAFTKAS